RRRWRWAGPRCPPTPPTTLRRRRRGPGRSWGRRESIAGNQSVTGQELAGGHRPLALGLDLANAQGTGPRGDDEVIAICGENSPRQGNRPPYHLRGFRGVRGLRGAADDETASPEKRKGVGPGVEPPHEIVNARGRPAPVDDPVFLLQPV